MAGSLSSTRLCLSALRRAIAKPLPCVASSLLRLPPEARTSLYHSRVAQFHASPRFNDATVAAQITNATGAATETAVSTASTLEHSLYALLELGHSSGASWAFIIPFSAICSRILLYPWAAADREGQQRYFFLQPLLNAWNIKYQDHVYFMHAQSRDSDWLQREHWSLMRSQRFRLLATWNATLWSRASLILVQLPVFLGMSSVYRRMCGLENGFLSAVLGALPLIGRRADTAAADGGSVSASMVSMTDPSLAYEGMLWFPNLMLPDTTLCLGGITAGINLIMLFLNTTRSRRAGMPAVKLSLWRRTILTLGAGLSLAIIPISASMPAGVMLYWASSTAATLVTNMMLDVSRPLKPAPTPCKKRAKVTFEIKRGQ